MYGNLNTGYRKTMRVAEKLYRIAIRYENFAKHETRPFVNDVHWPAYVYVPVSVCLSVNHESRPLRRGLWHNG